MTATIGEGDLLWEPSDNFKDSSRLVRFYSGTKTAKALEWPISGPRFQLYREGQTIFDGFAADNPTAATLTGLGFPVQLGAFRVTANYFDVLGIKPIRGRTFLSNEEEGADVAIVSEHFWKSRLSGDANVIGHSITLDGIAHTIVGVIPNMPVQWVGPNGNDVWVTKPFIILVFISLAMNNKHTSSLLVFSASCLHWNIQYVISSVFFFIV